MKKLLKRCIALIFAVIMMVAYTDMDAFAIQITGNAIGYIKATSTNNYLYADGNTVKFGAKKTNDSKYVWSIEKKGNEYWIKNNGTNTYMCLENEGGQTGTVRLEGTIYDVWESCRWYISGNAR